MFDFFMSYTELEKDGEISRETETKIIKYIDSQRVWTNG